MLGYIGSSFPRQGDACNSGKRLTLGTPPYFMEVTRLLKLTPIWIALGVRARPVDRGMSFTSNWDLTSPIRKMPGYRRRQIPSRLLTAGFQERGKQLLQWGGVDFTSANNPGSRGTKGRWNCWPPPWACLPHSATLSSPLGWGR